MKVTPGDSSDDDDECSRSASVHNTKLSSPAATPAGNLFLNEKRKRKKRKKKKQTIVAVNCCSQSEMSLEDSVMGLSEDPLPPKRRRDLLRGGAQQQDTVEFLPPLNTTLLPASELQQSSPLKTKKSTTESQSSTHGPQQMNTVSITKRDLRKKRMRKRSYGHCKSTFPWCILSAGSSRRRFNRQRSEFNSGIIMVFA